MGNQCHCCRTEAECTLAPPAPSTEGARGGEGYRPPPRREKGANISPPILVMLDGKEVRRWLQAINSSRSPGEG